MKILYILHSTEMSGAAISFMNMVLGLQEKGVAPVVVIPDNGVNPDFINIMRQNNIPCICSPIVQSIIIPLEKNHILHWFNLTLRLPIQKIRSKIRLTKIIREVKPDIIHTNTGVLHEGFHIALKYHIPHVWHLREYQTEDFRYHILPTYSKFCSYLTHSYVITITDGIRHYFKLDNKPNAQTIYNGIYHEYDVRYDNRKENYFLLSSRIIPEKGHLDVIKAFANFSRKGSYRLLIAGYGNEEYKATIMNTAKTMGCADSIEFIGFHRDVRPLMSKAKALIVASYHEGFGRMTAEAAFCGTLVIGRNSAGTKEIMDTIGGMAFNSIEEMTAQMENTANLTPAEYEEKALTAQKTAVAQYSIENNVNRIFELYAKILHNKL